MNYFCCLFAVYLCFTSLSLIASDIDLEERTDGFVLEIKRISIPGRPHAFNPSIIYWNGQLLMSFREITEVTHEPVISSSGNSVIGLVWLDEEFQPVGDPQILSLDLSEQPSPYFRYEEPRLVAAGDHLYLVYSDNKNPWVTEGGFRVYVAELDFDGKAFYVVDSERLAYFEDENKDRREKNWVPFDYQSNLLLAYSLAPHRIYLPLLMGTETCETVASSSTKALWQWGELRGGTPALLIDEDRSLAFFHSCMEMSSIQSNGKKALHYFMGAYTFSAHPPFEIQEISVEPIVAAGFYNGDNYEPYWKPVKVVFPCGLLVEKDFIWFSYGRDDHELWLAKIDKQALLDSLIPLPNLQEGLYDEARR